MCICMYDSTMRASIFVKYTNPKHHYLCISMYAYTQANVYIGMLHNDAQPMTHANTSNTSPAKSLQVLVHTCVHQYVYISISLYHIVACMCVYIHKHTHTILIQGTYALDLLRPSSYAIHTHSTLFSNIHTSVCMCMCVCVCVHVCTYTEIHMT